MQSINQYRYVQQNTHQIFVQCSDMISLAIYYHSAIKKLYILALKSDYFAKSLNRAIHLKEINIV